METLYAVVPHHIAGKPTGRGLVVRNIWPDGRFFDQANYGPASPLKTYKRESAAEAWIVKNRPSYE